MRKALFHQLLSDKLIITEKQVLLDMVWDPTEIVKTPQKIRPAFVWCKYICLGKQKSTALPCVLFETHILIWSLPTLQKYSVPALPPHSLPDVCDNQTIWQLLLSVNTKLKPILSLRNTGELSQAALSSSQHDAINILKDLVMCFSAIRKLWQFYLALLVHRNHRTVNVTLFT